MLSRPARLRLCRARDRLREEYDRPASIHALAREAGLSTGQFIRRFAAVFGETPHQHRIRVRLDRAKILLAAGEHSVTDVCFELGFASLGSFSALFTRRVGVAPSVYRRRIRTLVQAPKMLQRVLAPGCFGLMVDAFSALSTHSAPGAPGP